MTEPDEQPQTYVEMLDEYVGTQTWITPAERPLVFHARKLAAQLDRAIELGGESLAAKDSAYLQAVERLNKRRPVTTVPVAAQPLQGQTSVFDYLDGDA